MKEFIPKQYLKFTSVDNSSTPSKSYVPFIAAIDISPIDPVTQKIQVSPVLKGPEQNTVTNVYIVVEYPSKKITKTLPFQH